MGKHVSPTLASPRVEAGFSPPGGLPMSTGAAVLMQGCAESS